VSATSRRSAHYDVWFGDLSIASICAQFSTGSAVRAAHLQLRGQACPVITKEHTMITTVDTSHERLILTIDEAAACLAIPKAPL
jgi:hypothetical protein